MINPTSWLSDEDDNGELSKMMVNQVIDAGGIFSHHGDGVEMVMAWSRACRQRLGTLSRAFVVHCSF